MVTQRKSLCNSKGSCRIASDGLLASKGPSFKLSTAITRNMISLYLDLPVKNQLTSPQLWNRLSSPEFMRPKNKHDYLATLSIFNHN